MITPSHPDELDKILAERVHEPSSHEEAQEWIVESLQVLHDAEGKIQWTQVNWIWSMLLGHLPWTVAFAQHVYWHPASGVLLERSPRWAAKHAGNDEESMSAKDILVAPRPDFQYYWPTDIVRAWQNFWNVVSFWKPRDKKKLWDGPGKMTVKFDAGRETLEVEFLRHPGQTWATAVKLQKTFEKGLVAKDWIKKHPTRAELVRQAAEFELEVEEEKSRIKLERQKN